MVVYYINKVSDILHEYAFPIKEGDICMLYDGTVVKIIYVDSEVENDSIWRDFKFIDTKSLRSYHFPTTDSILCAPVGSKHALGNAGLITQLSQECTGEWLSDFLNETSAILSGFVDYWDLGILRRLTGDEDVAEVFEDENALSEFVEDEKVGKVEADDEEDDREDGFDIPENSDITTRNRYLMQFCYGILSEFQDALTDREKGICNMLLVENTRRKASEEYRITEERVRQIYVKSIKKISEAHKAAMQELDELRKENEELKRRNYLLEKELKGASNLDNVLSLLEKEDTLCYNAKRLLAYPPEELPLSKRTTNILRVAKIEYFKDIPQLTLEEVLKFRNCGRKTITELRDFMAKYSLDFGMTYEDIVLCMSKFVDGDFPPSLFAYQNIRNQMNVKTATDNVK